MRKTIQAFSKRGEKQAEAQEDEWKYEGDCSADGKYHGIGTLTNTVDKSYYSGQWENGVAEGFGTQVWPSLERYQGEWKEGTMHGLGVIVYPSSNTADKFEDKFEGTWEKGQRVQGKMAYVNSNNEQVFYEDSFVDGAPGPVGSLVWAAGKYTGEVGYTKDKKFAVPAYAVYRHGYGEMNWKDSSKYIGDWKDDNRAGFGLYYDNSGIRYYGTWSKGKKNGQGAFLEMDGTYYTGNFQHGDLRGKGKMGIPNGDVIQGEWNGNEIVNASYTIGSFFSLPRPARNLYVSACEKVQKEEDKSLFMSNNKWVGLFQDFLDIPNPNLQATSADLSDIFRDSPAAKELRQSLSLEPLLTAVERFVEYFEWSYGGSTNIIKGDKNDALDDSDLPPINDEFPTYDMDIISSPAAVALSCGGPAGGPEEMSGRSKGANSDSADDANGAGGKFVPRKGQLASLFDPAMEASREDGGAGAGEDGAAAEDGVEGNGTVSIDNNEAKGKKDDDSNDDNNHDNNHDNDDHAPPQPTATAPPTSPSSPVSSKIRNTNLKIKNVSNLLQRAIEDINSFVHNLSGSVSETFTLDFKFRKYIYTATTNYIFTKVHPLLWKFYTQEYSIKNALLQAKFLELENVTPALIGVKPKFHLEVKENEIPEFESLQHLQMSLRKVRQSQVIPGSGAGGGMGGLSGAELSLMMEVMGVDASTSLADSVGSASASGGGVVGIAPPPNPRMSRRPLPETPPPKDPTRTNRRSVADLGANLGQPNRLSILPSTPEGTPTPPAKPVPPPRKRGNEETSQSTSTSSVPSAASTSMINFTQMSLAHKPRRKNQGPYASVVKALDRLGEALTPMSKVKCLTSAAQQILECVDRFFSSQQEKDKKQIVMGAEDKFPVLIYSIIRAAIPDLWCHFHFLHDFVTDFTDDDEAKYRTTELGDALKYIMALNWQVRDEGEVLSPVKLIISQCLSSFQTLSRLKWPATVSSPSEAISSITLSLTHILRSLSRRYETPYSEYKISEEDAKVMDMCKPVRDVCTSVLGVKQLGLLLTVQETARSPPTFILNFGIKHPLHVYAKIAESIMTCEL